MSGDEGHRAPPLAAVIGWPVNHSRSPVLHGHWLRRYGIAGYYVPVAFSPEAFAEGLRVLDTAGFVETNMPAPHDAVALD